MAFNPTIADLWLEIKEAIQETEQHVEGSNDIMRRMTGRWYRKDLDGMEPEPENFGYAFMSNTLPVLSSDNPEVSVDAARVVGHKVIAQAMEDGIDATVEDLNWSELHEPVYVDYMSSRGVTMCYLDEDSRFSRGSVTPKVKRIAPSRFFIDSVADGTTNDEFRGHWYFADIDDLQNDQNINPDALLKLAPSQDDAAGTGQHSGKSAFNRKSGSKMGRRRVKCYSIWIRSTNKIRVLAEGLETIELYPERDYYGPECGPYQLYDAYPVPGQPWPLSPLVAVEDQSRDLNIHARAMGRSAARRKTVGLVEASNPDLGNKLENAEDGEIVPIKGITGNYAVIELGSATDKQFTFVEYIRNRLDRISGLTATVQGSVGQADTATEAKIADDALGARMKYLKKRIVKATEHSLWKIGWYLFHTEGVIIPVNRRDSYTGELVEGLFFGGPSPTDQQATWPDFGIKIRVNTMQEQMNSRQDMLAFYQVWLQVIQTAPLIPWARWMNVLRDIGDAFNLPNKADEWTIPEMFGATSQPQLFPVSSVMGPKQVPNRGAPSRLGFPGQSQQQAQLPGIGSNPQNTIGQGGQASGPRPQQVGGGQGGFNPLNRLA